MIFFKFAPHKKQLRMKSTVDGLTNFSCPVAKVNLTNYFEQAITAMLWLLFLSNLSFLIFDINPLRSIATDVFRFNGFTFLIWAVVTFFAAIVSGYSLKYLQGFKYRNRFTQNMLAFTFSVMLFAASNHLLVMLGTWVAMGYFMAQLIGADRGWGEAREAANYAQKWFIGSSLLLAVGLALLSYNVGSLSISEILLAVDELPKSVALIATLFIITAAIIQSAIYPFHRWLLSAMTAPTPASALMHAGFVNGSAILLTIFSTLLFAPGTLTLLFIIGGITAILAQFTKLLQTTVKQKLACSTIAQMGFMIMQCGLGFFNAAIAHLILHGFYKAYLFLSANENIAATAPQNSSSIKIKPMQLLVVLLFGIAGAMLFATLTGKGTAVDSGIFLTLIVAITVGQATYNIVKQNTLTTWQKAVMPVVLFFVGIGCYALIYNGVTKVMQDMPMVAVPMPVSFLQILVGIVFLIGFFIMKLGVYRKVSWIYVKLMNVSQPHHKTVLMFKK